MSIVTEFVQILAAGSGILEAVGFDSEQWPLRNLLGVLATSAVSKVNR